MGNKEWPSRKKLLEILASEWKPQIKTETVQVEDAIGRIAAEDVFSVHNLPVVRASAMDGIGVISSMFQEGVPETQKWRPGKEYERADTGDDFDDRYDAVIPIEQVVILEDGGILLSDEVKVKSGMNIRPCGSMLAKGDLLVKRWTKLTPSDLAALVMGGISEISVTKKPVAAFIPTGSELIPAGQKLIRGKNIDSNSILVKHMLLEMGAAPLCYPIVSDDPQRLEQALENALEQADIVILNGGSSKGGEDYNASLLKKKGHVLCHNVAAAPGRPICVALIDNKPVINLPGPSIACYYSMDWCIRFVVNTLLHQAGLKRKTISACLSEDIYSGQGMEILCKMEISKSDQGYKARQISFRESSVANSLIAPGQFITNPEISKQPAGSILEIELLRDENEL